MEDASPLGLFAEEVDPDADDQLGNYPQAFSLIGLMSSALRLGWALAAMRAAEAREEGEQTAQGASRAHELTKGGRRHVPPR